MKRIISACFTALTVGMLFTATAAPAAAPITATLAEAPSDRVNIIRNTPWVCNGETCSTSRARSNVRYECTRMARELGTVTAFNVGDRAFDAEELAACNGE